MAEWLDLPGAECGAQMPSADDGDYPPITWQEAREHLIRRLFIDDEWRVDHDQGFSWWPWFLRQDVAVAATDQGTGIDRPDTLLRVTATTETVRVPDEATGLHLVAEANRTFPFGAFILRDRTVVATSSVALNPLCRGMLTAFHQAMLVQATAAHQIADSYVSEPGVEILASDHPRSGARAEPDELLRIYAGDECALPPLDGFAQYLAAARPIYRELLIRAGLEPGFCIDDIDLFNITGMDIAISPTDGTPLGRRFGSGLVLQTRFLNPGERMPPSAVNALNQEISRQADASQLGPVLGDNDAIGYGLHTWTCLDQGFLGSVRGSTPDQLAMEIANAVYHAAAAVRLLLDSPTWNEQIGVR